MTPFNERSKTIMNFDKKAVMAFLLIGLVFLLVQTPLYKKAFFPQLYKQEQLRKALKDTVKTVPLASKGSEALYSQGDSNVAKSSSLVAAVQRETLYTVRTNLYTATFSNLGGRLTSWTLNKYVDGFGKPVQMVSEDMEGNLNISFHTKEGDSTSTALWPFSAGADTVMQVNGEKDVLRFIYSLAPDQQIIKEYRFYPNQYHFDLNLSLQNMEQVIANKAFTISAPTGLNCTEKRVKEDMNYAKAIVAAGGEINKSYKTNGQIYKETGSIDWIAVRTKYFAMAIIPTQSKGMYAHIYGTESVSKLDPAEKWKKIAISLTMPFTRNEYNETFKVFLGPMDDEILKSYAIGLENTMDMGPKFIAPISAAILWTFKRIHSFIPNYGVVLILFSLLIKIITTPLTNKSYSSMKKMQILQPKLAELKDKYGNDAQRLNKETMRLYKEEGINPMSGCFPILLQIPIFIALFNVFRATIELRQQGFFGWITDLSNPDTITTIGTISINILPILMGLTMIWQQKMSVTDPKQKAMVYLMPAMMIFLFYSFPSGLNLYYTIFNVLAMLQQKYLQPA
jgi:YidC/Oxa1 family membrane protein insertase